jgi:oligosaccharide repeat unit polymerase
MDAMLIGVVFLGFMLLLSLALTGIYSPSSLMLLVWCLEFAVQFWFKFYEIGLGTALLLLLFITCFVLGSFLGSSVRFKKSQYIWSEDRIYRVIICVSLLLGIVAPFLYANLAKNIDDNIPNLAQSVRNFYVESARSGYVPITITLVANFSIVLIVLLVASPITKIKLHMKSFLITYGLIGTAISFSKGYFLLLLAYIMSIQIFRRKRPYIFLLAGLCVTCLILIASAVVRDRLDVMQYLRTYTMSPVAAFQLIVDGKFHFPFPALFGFLKPIFRLFGSTIEPPSADANFVEVPDYTNVFTAFGPALSDYGVLFTALYFVLNGFGSGIVFSLARANYAIFRIMYGYVIFAIGASLFSDGFANWSTILNYSLVFLAINYYARRRSHLTRLLQ